MLVNFFITVLPFFKFKSISLWKLPVEVSSGIISISWELQVFLQFKTNCWWCIIHALLFLLQWQIKMLLFYGCAVAWLITVDTCCHILVNFLPRCVNSVTWCRSSSNHTDYEIPNSFSVKSVRNLGPTYCQPAENCIHLCAGIVKYFHFTLYGPCDN